MCLGRLRCAARLFAGGLRVQQVGAVLFQLHGRGHAEPLGGEPLDEGGLFQRGLANAGGGQQVVQPAAGMNADHNELCARCQLRRQCLDELASAFRLGDVGADEGQLGFLCLCQRGQGLFQRLNVDQRVAFLELFRLMARGVAGGQRTVAVAVGDPGRVMGKAFQQALAQRWGAGACFQQGQPLAFGQGGQGCFHQAAQLAGQYLPAAFANQDAVDACQVFVGDAQAFQGVGATRQGFLVQAEPAHQMNGGEVVRVVLDQQLPDGFRGQGC